jgi:hypothetical protein
MEKKPSSLIHISEKREAISPLLFIFNKSAREINKPNVSIKYLNCFSATIKF